MNLIEFENNTLIFLLAVTFSFIRVHLGIVIEICSVTFVV